MKAKLSPQRSSNLILDHDMPDAAIRRIQRWATERVPADADYRIEVGARHLAITISQSRPLGPVSGEWLSMRQAQLRYNPVHGLWTVWWSDRADRWHLCDDCLATRQIGRVLAYLDEDVDGVFWN